MCAELLVVSDAHCVLEAPRIFSIILFLVSRSAYNLTLDVDIGTRGLVQLLAHFVESVENFMETSANGYYLFASGL